jgi:hypothetical protein
MSFIIVSYYTLDTPYQDVAHKYLMNSLSTVEVKSDIRGVQNLGSWQANTSYKPTFILQMLEHHKDTDIVFVDADAEILDYPSLFENIPTDCSLGVHFLDRTAWYGHNYPEEKELLSGTLYVRNNEEARQVVLQWIEQCKNTRQWEQQVLHNIIVNRGIKTYELPIEYCYIKTMPNGEEPKVKVEKPIIVHNQVSRRIKNMVK